jgi:hypothetical protein
MFFHTFIYTYFESTFLCLYVCFQNSRFWSPKDFFLVYIIMIEPLMLIINLIISKNHLAYIKKQV